MRSIKLVICVTMCCIILQLFSVEINAACVCNEKGTDYCAGCNEQLIVRPQPKYHNSNPDVELPPIGDNCWCSKLMIEPAALPKPLPCPKYNTPTCGCKKSPAPSYGDKYSIPYAPSYVPIKPQDNSLPADPISVSLAIRAGKAIEVPEAKLAYGFVQKPLDGLKKIYFSNVPEENLFKLKNDVITLKKPRPAPKEEEEYEIEEDEEAPPDDDVPPHLTYRQLGYTPEQFKNPKFRKVSSMYSAYATPDDNYSYKPAYKSDYSTGYKSDYSTGSKSDYSRGGYKSDYAGGYKSDYAGGYKSDYTGGYKSGYTGGYKSDYSSGYKSDYNTEYKSDYSSGYKSDYKKVSVDCGFKPGRISSGCFEHL